MFWLQTKSNKIRECIYLFICGLYMHLHLSRCVYAGSSLKFQCVDIKPEADTNECSHDDKPSTGMFAGYGKQLLFHLY